MQKGFFFEKIERLSAGEQLVAKFNSTRDTRGRIPASVSEKNGFACAYRRFMTSNLGSVISSIAYRKPSRPRPESFTPPYGM